MQAIELANIDWSDVRGLFEASLVRHQARSGAMLLRTEVDPPGLAIHWYVAPFQHYLFFVPRYRADERWRNLRQWHASFFEPKIVLEIKEFARKKKWSIRKLPILARVNVEPLAAFGKDFDDWNELVEVEEYVLPLGRDSTRDLLAYLREWEQTFPQYVYREATADSPVVLSANDDLTLALHATPLGTEPVRMIDVAAWCESMLRKVISEWSEGQVLQHLFVQDICPMLQRHDLVKGFPISVEAKSAWDKVYELRVAFLEKFQFPWFYAPALAMLGAEGGKKALTAEQLVEQAFAPLTRPVCPPELQSRIGRVALRLERAYPILTRKPITELII